MDQLCSEVRVILSFDFSYVCTEISYPLMSSRLTLVGKASFLYGYWLLSTSN